MQTRSSSEGEAPAAVEADWSTNQRTHWTFKDEAALITFLTEKTVAGTSDNTFKDSVFKEAADMLNASRTVGGQKTMTSCKSKWMRVCISLYVFYLYPDLYDKLKKTFEAVTQLKSKSGFSWSDEKGMGVEDEKDPAWAALVEVCEPMSYPSMVSDHY
jgi:hypothetical protein